MRKRKKALQIVAVIVCIYLLVSWGKSAVKTYRSRSRIKHLRENLRESTERIQSLEKQLEEQQTDQFVEEQARNKLNLIKPGEKTVVLGEKQTNEQANPQNKKSSWKNWEKWRYLFLHF